MIRKEVFIYIVPVLVLFLISWLTSLLFDRASYQPIFAAWLLTSINFIVALWSLTVAQRKAFLLSMVLVFGGGGLRMLLMISSVIIIMLKKATERALNEGYQALRVTGEPTCALKGLPGSNRLFEYEVKLNDFFPSSKCMGICQYDRRQFDSGMLLDVLATHPIVVIGTQIFDNFYLNLIQYILANILQFYFL